MIEYQLINHLFFNQNICCGYSKEPRNETVLLSFKLEFNSDESEKKNTIFSSKLCLSRLCIQYAGMIYLSEYVNLNSRDRNITGNSQKSWTEYLFEIFSTRILC